jgi:transcriptional regulator with XRE-family HTH domain
MFDPGRLKELRNEHGMTQAALGEKLGVSAAQIHRLEQGHRRITIDKLVAYCEALGIGVETLFNTRTTVPIIGIINAESQVLSLPPNTPYETLAPNLVSDPHRMAAVRWAATGRIEVMHDHLMYFYKDIEGVPDDAWNQRCFIRRKDGTARIGWPVLNDGQIHVSDTTISPEYNIEIESASPILAVVTPYLLDRLP